MDTDVEKQVRGFILDNFLFSDDEDRLRRDMSLFDSGVVNSTGVLEIVGFIEESFELQVDDTELIPENFETIARISAYIERKLAGGGA
jgi:acyl carrier protein